MKRSAIAVLKPKGDVRKPARAIIRVKPRPAVPTSTANGKAKGSLKPNVVVPSLAAELQALQRQRVWHIKTRIMVSNRLRATVAGTLGYHSGMKESNRAKAWKEAAELIERLKAGEERPTLSGIVLTTLPTIQASEDMEASLEKKMLQIAKQLPVAGWAEKQRGFGLLGLAKIIGETGDLSGYANPGKVWRRMGCAPFIHDGKTAMGGTWRRGKEGKLPAEAWEAFGYSPRRRSIMFVVSETLLKLNDGAYRKRYDEAKAAFQANHPDYKPLRCHLHGMLVMSKRLLRDLWLEWRK